MIVRALFLLFFAGGAWGAVPGEFAFGMKITAPPGGSVYALDLPLPVYAGLARADLGDMRVFNGRGEEVPFVLRGPRFVMGEAPPPVSLPVLPLYGEAAADPDLSFWVRTHPDGALLGMQNGRTLVEEQPAAYLLDLSALHDRPAAIELSWRMAQGAKGFMARLSLSSSDDLQQWSELSAEATIADLGYGGNRLQRRRLILPPAQGRYLRIEWPAEAHSATLEAAQAQFAAPPSHPARNWLPLEGKRREREPNRFYFLSGTYLPVDCVRIVPRESNTVVPVRLFSRAGADAPWRARGEGLVYNLTLGADLLAGEPFCFAPVTDPSWRLEAASEGGGFGTVSPRIELGWNPHRLLFLARGPGPFTLAYGSVAQGPASAAIDPLLQDLEAQNTGLLKAATAGEPFALGGAGRLKGAEPFLQRRAMLWAVLAVGVMVLAWMAKRLAEEMRRPPQ